MAREWLLRGVDPEELKPTPKDEGPQTPRSKWENFWFHHKLKFWLIVFVAVVTVVGITQLFTRDKPDYYVLLITEVAYTNPEREALAALLEDYGVDLDGDGKVEVQVENCCFTADQNRNSSIQQIQAHLVSGDRLFFIWDPAGYEYFEKSVLNEYKGDGYLATITARDAGLIKGDTVWSWSEDDRVTKEMKELWPDLYFGVRNAGNSKDSKALFKDSYALLDALVADEKPQK